MPPRTLTRRRIARFASSLLLGGAAAPAVAQAPVADWLRQINEHHRQIRNAFTDVSDARDAAERRAAERALRRLLTAHSFAEETAIYPGLAAVGQKAEAERAYGEHGHAKIELAELDIIPDKMSPPYLAKLYAFQKAVALHIREEQSILYPALAKAADAALAKRMSDAYRAEFARYVA